MKSGKILDEAKRLTATDRQDIYGDPYINHKRIADLWMALNNDPEMKELAAKSGFELVNVGTADMDAFMKEKAKLYTDGARLLGLGKK